MGEKNPELDSFFEKEKPFKEIMVKLRSVCLESGLQEEKKWWQPCYTYEGKNVAIIGAFKDFCTLSFFKGSLIKDPKNILEFPGPNTRSAKIIKFRNSKDFEDKKPFLITYLENAIYVEKAGKSIPKNNDKEDSYPKELIQILSKDREYQQAFEKLTPGRKRSFLLHFNSAKQSKTIHTRIEKARSKIMEGKGFNEY